MSPFLIIAALAAQTTAPGGISPSSDTTAPKIGSGETNYLDIEAGAGYSSNPNFSLIGNQGSAFGRISLHAVHSRVSARSTTLLSGYVENLSYTNHLGSQQSVSLLARHDAAVTEHVRIFGDLSGSYQEGGQLDTRVIGLPLLPPETPGGTITPPILIPPNSDFLSVTGRTYSFSGHLGGSFALGPRDSLTLSSGVAHVVFRNGSLRTSYTQIPVSLAYDRQLSTRSSLGARVTAEQTDYDGPTNFRVITPQLTARTLLAPRVSLDGAIGVSLARIDNGLTVRNTTGVSAQANVCGEGESSYFCGHFNVDEQATTTAGPARSIGGGVDYSRRLGANQTINLSAGVTHYTAPTSVITSRTFSASTYYRAAVSYSRQIGTRLYGGVNLAARNVTQNGPDPKADLSASLFLGYRLGDVQ